LKVGLQYRTGKYVTTGGSANGNLIQQYRAGVPSSVVVYPVPYVSGQSAAEWAPFAMDIWTIHRLTVSAGVRLDEFYAAIGPEARPAPCTRISGR
jgi:hypothetical protein